MEGAPVPGSEAGILLRQQRGGRRRRQRERGGEGHEAIALFQLRFADPTLARRPSDAVTLI